MLVGWVCIGNLECFWIAVFFCVWFVVLVVGLLVVDLFGDGLIVVFVCALFYDLPMRVIGVVWLVGYFWFVILRLALLSIRFVAFLRV